MSRLIISLLFTLLIPATVSASVSIATTLRPLHFIIRAVAGDEADLVSVVDVNDSPHHFTLSPADRLNLEAADILVWAGPDIEVSLEDYFQGLDDSRAVISLTELEGFNSLYHDDGELDPHFWLDPANAALFARYLTTQLTIADAANASRYEFNLNTFIEQLSNLSSDVQSRFDGSAPVVIVYHNAYQYFEERFGLSHTLALVHNPEVAPGMRESLRVRNAIANSGAHCLLLEPDHNPALLATLLEDNPIRRIVVDPLGYGIPDQQDSYLQLLNSVADAYAQCNTTSE